MRTLKIIDCLYLNEDGVRVRAKNGRFQQVHLRQGELDGACAVYSAFMALICIGVVKYNDITVCRFDCFLYCLLDLVADKYLMRFLFVV